MQLIFQIFQIFIIHTKFRTLHAPLLLSSLLFFPLLHSSLFFSLFYSILFYTLFFSFLFFCSFLCFFFSPLTFSSSPLCSFILFCFFLFSSVLFLRSYWVWNRVCTCPWGWSRAKWFRSWNNRRHGKNQIRPTNHFGIIYPTLWGGHFFLVG